MNKITSFLTKAVFRFRFESSLTKKDSSGRLSAHNLHISISNNHKYIITKLTSVFKTILCTTKNTTNKFVTQFIIC